MTRPKASRYPVSSFGPELMEALLRASREEIRIPFKSFREMCAFQQRIHNLRGAMSRERHPSYAIATRVKTSRYWEVENQKKTNCVLIMRPRDSEFAEALLAAGIVVTPPAQDLLLEAPPPSTPRDPSIEHGPALGDDVVSDPTDQSTSPYGDYLK